MKNNFLMMLLAFIAGVIVAALVAWLLCCNCCKSGCSHKQCSAAPDSTGIMKVTSGEAQTIKTAYLKDKPVSVDTLRAFSINIAQFNAMKLIALKDTNLLGFRVYMGLDGRTPVRLVVGFGSPDHVEAIYKTTEDNSGPCPDVCDDSTPAVHD
jgi:hypothetical protein